nr:DUF3087 domain-containing protein [Gayadomonas joobiniege]
MQFEAVDKSRYRNHLNKIIVASIVVLAGLSLAISQTLILLFPDPDGSHFHWNLSGVILGCVAVGLLLRHFKAHPFMTEVYYVWRLKQHLNWIQRKNKSLKTAVDQGDAQAMQILWFYYQGLRKLWQLDDNTITMEELAIWQTELESKANQENVQLSKTQFDKSELSPY